MRSSHGRWWRVAGAALAVLALTLPAAASAGSKSKKAPPPDLRFNVLVVTTNNDATTQAGLAAIRAAGQTPHAQFKWYVNAPDPGTAGDQFTVKRLAKYRAVVFLNTGASSGLTADQQSAFETYFHTGGGLLTIGSAIETDPSWSFLTNALGTRAATKTAEQAGTVKVVDRVHEATKDLPQYWDRTDQWYYFTSNVRGFAHVLATVVEQPFMPQPQGKVLTGITGGTGSFTGDHPVVWCKDFSGGRSFYDSLGNNASSYSDSNYKSMLKGAIDWTAGVADPTYSDCGATVLANYVQTTIAHNIAVASQSPLQEPIGFDRLPDGRLIQTSRRGEVFLHDPVAGTSTQIATIPVYNNSEDGLYGPGIDNNFSTDHWVYLYYAPKVVDNITYSDGTTGHTNDFTNPPFSNSSAPTQAVNISDFDPWIGYFQLSRFKFVDDAGNPHLDLSSEQQILRVSNNRGACCHVAGDIEFDKHNNLYLPTGDDSAAGSGDAGAWGQSIDQKTDENQTVRVNGAPTGGTFTLTFDGQTTSPIPFNATAAQVASALQALSSVGGAANLQATGGPANTSNVLVTWKGQFEEQNVSTLTTDASGLTGGTSPSVAIGVGSGAGGSNTSARQGGLWRMPAADSGRSAQNTNDLRGKVNRITVKAADIAPADFNHADYGSGGAYTIPAGNLFPLVAGAPQPKTRPEIYSMGFRNPFRISVDKNDVLYVSDYSPDSQTPQQFHGPPGVGRYEVVRQASNFGWPYCYKSDLPEYPWNVNLQVPMNLTDHQPVPAGVTPQPYDCSNPAGFHNNDYWNLNGGPSVQAGLAVTPPVSAPLIWYSYRDNNTTTPLGTPCLAYYGPAAPGTPVPGSTTSCPRLFPELYTGGVGPHGIAKYDYSPSNTDPGKFPPYYDGKIVLGEFTQNTMRLASLDSDNQVQKVDPFMNCTAQTAVKTPATPFECTNPMDMFWGKDGHFYLMTYGNGFFNINPGAAIFRFDYVKGQRPPVAVVSADRTNGTVPLTVNFSSAGSNTPEPSESITFSWDFGDGSPTSLDANPTHTYTHTGVYTAVLTVTDSSGKTAKASIKIVAGNTAPTVVVNTPVEGGTFTFGDDIPYSVTVTDPEDGTIDCSKVQVTFVLGHDTHGHAEGGTTGCTGVLHTIAGDVSHGGNVFGVISATYTDNGGAGGTPPLSTTSQHNIRQKDQQVEFAVNQSGTNTATDNDGGGAAGPPGNPGVHRGSLSDGDWIQLNGPFNLVNINSVTFRVADASAGRTAGSPLAAIEIHQDAVNGPIVQTDALTSTGGTAVWSSQNFPISLSGTHELFLVFRAVTGGSTGTNLFNLNWAQFQGAGVGVPGS